MAVSEPIDPRVRLAISQWPVPDRPLPLFPARSAASRRSIVAGEIRANSTFSASGDPQLAVPLQRADQLRQRRRQPLAARPVQDRPAQSDDPDDPLVIDDQPPSTRRRPAPAKRPLRRQPGRTQRRRA